MAEPFQLETSVVFLVFNRPEHTQRVFGEIRRARPPRLYVVGDGPRADRPDDVSRVNEVREIIARGVDWPCAVHTNYAERNLGCGRRVSSGLDWVFAQEQEAIVLEDDCLPDPTFFRFCAELLARYRDDMRIAQIAGCSFQEQVQGGLPSYYFSRYPHCWGWATWRRAWRLYDHSMQAWQSDRGGDWFAEYVKDREERKYWEKRFDDTLRGKMDSWAYRWTIAVWRERCSGILPYRNLVANIGIGTGSTHTDGSDRMGPQPLAPMLFPLAHPTGFERDTTADDRTGRLMFRLPSLDSRVRHRLRKIFG